MNFLNYFKGIHVNALFYSYIRESKSDNLYYLGILKLYGITLSKDLRGAGQYFTKAASMGHADSQTAVESTT